MLSGVLIHAGIRNQRRNQGAQDEVEGEKLVTRYILEQTRRNGGDLAVIMSQLDGVDLKGLVRDVRGLQSDVRGLQGDVRGLKSDVRDLQSKTGALDAKLTGLIHNRPAMITEAVREGLKESGRKA